MRIGVLGAGAWGAALAATFASQHPVTLWARSAVQRDSLARTRGCGYLPGVQLPTNVAIAESIETTVADSELLVLATPTAGLRETLQRISAIGARVPLVWVCKGFEQQTGALPHSIVAATVGDSVPCAVLSGPSFALEVARGQPTALTLASQDEGFAAATAKALHQSRLRVYFSTDVVGVEVGGAIKNVMAIATGIADGLGLGMNARAGLITRGLAELTRLGVAMGGRIETFMGLSGIGDLVLTCTGDLSRNRRVGLELAQGKSLAQVLETLGHVAEGVYTARAVLGQARSIGIDMPISAAVCQVLFEGVAPRAAVEQLLARDPKGE